MRHETFSFVCMWTICCAQGLREDLMWLKKQLLKEYELETMLMGQDDNMEKKAISLSRTLERSVNGLGQRPDRRHVRS